VELHLIRELRLGIDVKREELLVGPLLEVAALRGTNALTALMDH
jgi:hypothetical protein